MTPADRALDYLTANPTRAAALDASGGWRPSGGGQR